LLERVESMQAKLDALLTRMDVENVIINIYPFIRHLYFDIFGYLLVFNSRITFDTLIIFVEY